MVQLYTQSELFRMFRLNQNKMFYIAYSKLDPPTCQRIYQRNRFGASITQNEHGGVTC